MNRYGPDYGDDPRREALGAGASPPYSPSEESRRTARRGSDLARAALGQAPKYSPESKLPFDSIESLRIKGLIDNSEIQKPIIRNRIIEIINNALNDNLITSDEADGLTHYLNNAEGFTDDTGPKDFREVQHND